MIDPNPCLNGWSADVQVFSRRKNVNCHGPVPLLRSIRTQRGPIMLFVVVFGGMPAFVSGCNSGTLTFRPPAINASSAGSQALAMYDKNGDGLVSGEELDRVPA